MFRIVLLVDGHILGQTVLMSSLFNQFHLSLLGIKTQIALFIMTYMRLLELPSLCIYCAARNFSYTFLPYLNWFAKSGKFTSLTHKLAAKGNNSHWMKIIHNRSSKFKFNVLHYGKNFFIALFPHTNTLVWKLQSIELYEYFSA